MTDEEIKDFSEKVKQSIKDFLDSNYPNLKCHLCLQGKILDFSNKGQVSNVSIEIFKSDLS